MFFRGMIHIVIFIAKYVCLNMFKQEFLFFKNVFWNIQKFQKLSKCFQTVGINTIHFEKQGLWAWACCVFISGSLGPFCTLLPWRTPSFAPCQFFTGLVPNSIFFFLFVKNHWFAWRANKWSLVGETQFYSVPPSRHGILQGPSTRLLCYFQNLSGVPR